MKVFTLFSIFVFSCVALKAQNITLNWESPKVYYNAINTNSYPYFSNPGYWLSGELPMFTYTEFNTTKSIVEVENWLWEEISKEDLAATPLSDLPLKEEYTAKVVKSRNIPNLLVEIVPFKYENGKIYRLKSFTIETDTSPVNTTFGPITDFSDSVLKYGDYYKISVDTTGVYKIDYDFLQAHGLNPSNINPSKIKIYGNGGAMMSERIDDFAFLDLQENAIKVVDGGDGSFDTGDYILFYAQGPQSIKRNVLTQPMHITNLYEDKAYYFIRVDGSNGLRVNEVTTPTTTDYLTEFDDIRVVEPELYNVNSVGRVWVGENFTLENIQEYAFDNIIEFSSSTPVRCQLSLYTQNAFGHMVDVKVNGNTIINSSTHSNSDFFKDNFLANFNLTGSSLNVTIDVDNSNNPLGTTWFDYIEFFFRQNLKFNGSQFNFRRLDNINNGNLYGFSIANAANISEVWNVSNWVQPTHVLNHGNSGSYQFSFQSTNLDFPNEFVAFNVDAAYKPEFIGKIQNQNIRGLEEVDYLIISGEGLNSAATKISNFHKTENNLNTGIVTPQEIYNEFSSGSQDISAIRNFVRFLYKKDNRLKYLLLLGDASYDFKDRIPNNSNIIPAYQSANSINLSTSYVTDDFYAILDDGEENLSSIQLDIAVGRLPADDLTEATEMVNKVLSYENALPGQSTPFGIWRTKAKIVVDDNDPNNPFHQTIEPSVSHYIELQEPQLNVRKLYMDAFSEEVTSGGLRYPSVNEEIDNSIESGCLFMNYFGHGGPRSWAQERVLTEDQILSYQNINSVFTRLPLFVTVTCDFAIWDNPEINSAGEYLVKTNQGGAAASITTSRAIGIPYGEAFNGVLVRQLITEVGNEFQSLGEALRNAKINYSNGDNYKTNLLGDPAISLYRPPRKLQLNTINGIPADSFTGTLRALDFVTLEGVVLNESETGTDTSFNGKVEIELYDKIQQKHTLNNNGSMGVMQYPEQSTRIYSGSSSVTNGTFNIEFYMPLDINYEVGDGKLVVYADNNKTDGLYFDNTIKVGDLNPDGIVDDEPPVAKLYLNNRHFANGGITNKDPIFIACLTDSTGINSTGIGIGHDITLVLDGNINETKVLNAFYQGGESLDCPNPTLKDFQKGMVSYNLKDIPKGNHQIKFKVWDINNNSTVETLDFVVVQEGEIGLVINRLLNWPNPFTDKTYFHFEHNCDQILEVQIQIFTVSGKLVKTIRQSVTSDPYRKGYRTDKFGIPWDGLDDFGNKIGKGTYIFKATVKGSNTETCSGTATAIEKLVILK